MIMGKANPMQGAVGSGACFVNMNGEDDRFANTGAMMLTEDQMNPLVAPGIYDPLTEEVRINPRKKQPKGQQSSQGYLSIMNEKRKDKERTTWWRQASKRNEDEVASA